MFAEFGATAETTGSLVDWKKLSRQVKKAGNGKTSTHQHDEQSQKLIQFFQANLVEPIPSMPLSFKDKVILMLTEASALVAPLIYLALVSSILSLAVWYFSHLMVSEIDWAWAPLEMALPALLCLFILPLILKPLFGGYASYQGRALSYDEAPALFELVSGISQMMGMPMPKRIELNNDATLYMDATGGVNSALRRDLKLVIGAPVLSGMTVQQIAGLIAHEMGHYNHSNLILAYFYISRGKRWLHYRAFAQDSWLKAIRFKLENGQRSIVSLRFYAMTRFTMLLIKRFFAGLYFLHKKMTSVMAKRMEMNADSYSVHLIGSQAFAEMIKKLRCLQAAKEQVALANSQAWKEGRLFSHSGFAIARAAQQMSPQQLKKVDASMRTPAASDCPSDTERVQAALQKNQISRFNANVASTSLLSDLKWDGKQLTLLDYQMMGIKDAEKHMVANEIIFAMKDHANQFRLQADFYFNKRQQGRWLSLSRPESPADRQRTLQQTIDRIRDRRVDDSKFVQQLDLLKKKRQLLQLAESFGRAGMKPERYIKMSGGLPSNIPLVLMQAEKQEKERVSFLEEVDHLYFQRILLVTKKMSPNDRLSVDMPLKNLLRLSQFSDQIQQLENTLYEFSTLRQHVRLDNNIALRELLQQQKQSLSDSLLSLVSVIQRSQIRLNTDHGVCTLYQYVRDWSGPLPEAGQGMEVTQLADKLEKMLEAVRYQYDKWLGLVALTCSRYEKALKVVPVNRVTDRS